MLCDLETIEKMLERWAKILLEDCELMEVLDPCDIVLDDEILSVGGQIALIRKDIQQGNGS